MTKDRGLIAYGMHEYGGCDAFIATYFNGGYPNLKYTPGLRLEEIPRRTGRWTSDSCIWLMKNAGRIDVLNLFLININSFLHTLIYKTLNPRGRVYLRTDGWPSPSRSTFWRVPLHKWTLRHCALVSTELEEHAGMMSRDWGREISFIPNPYNPAELLDFRAWPERGNIILTTGRLGTHQKATEILLEAFARISSRIPGWSLKLAGRLEENVNIADEFYSGHPELKDRVIFTGQIDDRNELVELYREAKIFAFPSRWESWGLSLSEAMLHGCFPVVTRIPSFRIITEDFRYGLGSEVDDVDGLAGNLLYACTHEKEIDRLAIEGREAVLRRCDLREIIKKITPSLLRG